MTGSSHSGNRLNRGTKSGSSGKGALLLAILGVAGIIVVIVAFNSGPPLQAPDVKPPTQQTSAKVSPTLNDSTKSRLGAVVPSNENPAQEAKIPKKIVADIVSVATITNAVSPEDAKKFKEGLAELIRQGPASVPAIQDYLDKNVDSNYGDVKGAEELGYSSLRHALLDTLKQIGGPEAQGAMLHVLQTTAEANEVHELASDLEAQSPGQYRDQVLQAAKEALDLSYQNQLGSNFERGPLFRVFQMYGANYAPPPGAVTVQPAGEIPPPGQR